MRLPTSVIVMSLVTAVPFGLGIRDTLKKKEVSADEFDGGVDFGRKRSTHERERDLAEYEAELRREQLEREEKSRERVAKLDQLIGGHPAQMGSLLEGIQLGAGAGSFQPENVRRRIEHATRDGFINVSFDADAATLNAVQVTVYSDDDSDACEKLGDKLVDAWGSSPTRAWLDPSTRTRATYAEEDCRLTFDRYVEPTDWVAQLPLSAIGMSAEKFSAQLGPASEYDEDRLYWEIPGLRFGKGTTKLEAYVGRGEKIVGFKATVSSDFDSSLGVRDALAVKLKAQPKKLTEDDDYSDLNIWEWKRRVPVTLDQFDTDRFSVMVGKMPWD
ncbi:MAG TPA: hypothetical protein VIV11_38485 [Kofleriaceae bacterium]